MAATRSTLLEGLEEISEEEQLSRLLEISKQDFGPDRDSTPPPDPVSNSYEEWASIPADVRLQMVSGTVSPDTRPDQISEDEEDEEYRKAIEVSKKEKFLTEEEKTALSIMQSLSLAERNNARSSPVLQQETQPPADLGEDLESAIRSSLGQSFDLAPAPAPAPPPVQLGARPRTVAQSQPQTRPQPKLRTIVIDGSNVCCLKKVCRHLILHIYLYYI